MRPIVEVEATICTVTKEIYGQLCWPFISLSRRWQGRAGTRRHTACRRRSYTTTASHRIQFCTLWTDKRNAYFAAWLAKHEGPQKMASERLRGPQWSMSPRSICKLLSAYRWGKSVSIAVSPVLSYILRRQGVNNLPKVVTPHHNESQSRVWRPGRLFLPRHYKEYMAVIGGFITNRRTIHKYTNK